VFVGRSDERGLVALAAPMYGQLQWGAEVVEPSHMSNERSSMCTHVLNI
jgi:hypothetical protein